MKLVPPPVGSHPQLVEKVSAHPLLFHYGFIHAAGLLPYFWLTLRIGLRFTSIIVADSAIGFIF